MGDHRLGTPCWGATLILVVLLGACGGDKRKAGLCQSGNECSTNACYDSQCVSLCSQQQCTDKGLTCVIAKDKTLCVDPKLVSFGQETPGDLSAADKTTGTENSDVGQNNDLGLQPDLEADTTAPGDANSDGTLADVGAGDTADGKADDAGVGDVAADQLSVDTPSDGADGEIPKDGTNDDASNSDVAPDSSDPADAGDTTDVVAGPVCPNYRSDLTIAQRLAPSVETALADQAIYQVALGTNGTDLYLGGVTGVTRYLPPSVTPTGFRATGFVTALLVTNDRVFVGRDDAEPNNFVSLSLDLQTQHSALQLSDNPIFLLQDPTTATVLYAGGRAGNILRSTDYGVSFEGTAFGHSDAAHISQLIAIANTDWIIAATGDGNVLLEYQDGDLSFTKFTFTPQTSPNVAMFGWANWKSGENAVVISGSGSQGYAVYACEVPCRTPTLLGDSHLIGGQIVNSHSNGALGTFVRAGQGLIVTATSTELWISSDDGATFRLVETLWDCNDPGTIYDIELAGDTLLVGTSVGLKRLAIAELK